MSQQTEHSRAKKTINQRRPLYWYTKTNPGTH